MGLLLAFNSALIALKSNKIRSFLTMLGVIIGVFAVIALVAVVQGVKIFVTEQFSAIGSDLILVAPGRVSFTSNPNLAFTNNKLEPEDADLIEKEAGDYIVGATPNIRLSKTVSNKNKKFLGTLVGTNYRFLEITNFELEKGISFTKVDQEESRKVVLIGPEVENSLFGNINPVGKTVKIDNISFEVIGTLKPRGPSGDDRIVTPYTTIQKSLGVKNLSGITVKAKSNEVIDLAINRIKYALLQTHKPDEFGVLTQKDILSSIQSIIQVLTIGIGAIAGISLLVGGIGVMNIMLVSVKEREKEIGLRKALGATPNIIATQFLSEAIIISVLGGVVGILLGLLLSYSTKDILRSQVPLWIIALSFGFSLLVGIIFGTYPAIKAGKKDPIEALRYE